MAYDIVKNIDVDDVVFVAMYFYKKHKIWTGDKKLINGLKAKGLDICISSKTLELSLYKR